MQAPQEGATWGDAHDLPVEALRRPGLLSADPGPLHIGPVRDDSIAMFLVVGNGLRVNDTTRTFSDVINQAEVFRTSLVYDRLLSRNRLAIQYVPELVIIDGRLQHDLSNQAVSIGTQFVLGPRWRLGLSDGFSTRAGGIISDDPTLVVDTTTGSTGQNPFLQNRRRYVSDSGTAGLTYLAGLRDTFTFTGGATYEHTSLANEPTSAYTYSGTFGWNHALTRTQSIGLFFGESRRNFSRTLTSTSFTDFGVGYSYRFAPSWQFNISAGASTASESGGRAWTYTGNAGLYKTFRRSAVSLAYYRGNEVGPFISDRFGSRVGLGYSIQLFRRWSAGAELSYQEGNTSNPLLGKTHGTSGAAHLNFQATERTTWFVSYGRLQESGTSPDQITGRHFAVSTGMRWSSHVPGY